MPGGDRTGPLGAGPRTGRAAGYCAGYGMPGFTNFWGGRGYGRGGGFGRGFGFGGGHGRGWRHRFFPGGMPWPGRRGGWFAPDYDYMPGYAMGPSYQDEKLALKEEAEHLRSALDEINRRLDEIQAKKEGE